MKKYLILFGAIFFGISLTINTMAQKNEKVGNSDTLHILWTSGDPDVAIKMVFMYAQASKQNS